MKAPRSRQKERASSGHNSPFFSTQTKGEAAETHAFFRPIVTQSNPNNLQRAVDHVPDDGWRFTVPPPLTRTVREIQAIVGTNPDGVYGPDTKEKVNRYQTQLRSEGLFAGTINGEWHSDTDVAHEAFATGPGPERQSYNCAGFAFKRYTFIGLPATRAIYSSMTHLPACTDQCPSRHYKFWMWEFDINTEDTRTGQKSPDTRDFHTVGGQTDAAGNGPGQVMSKDGPRPVIGPGTPMSFKPLAREKVVQVDGSRHPFLVWNVSNIDQKCFCSERLP